MKAGIDLDGVIADLITPLLKAIKKEYGLSFKYEDITSFYFADCIPQLNWNQIREIWESPEFVLGQPLIPWAKWGLNRLRALGYAIYIITARKTFLKEATLEWLAKHGIAFDAIVTGKEEKWSYIERNELNILVEDKAQNALDVARLCERIYLIDTPYNRDPVTLDESKSSIIRVKGWKEIIKLEKEFLR